MGAEVFRVQATDPDSGSNGAISYRFVNVGGVNSPFFFNSASGSMALQQPLDRETTASYTVSCKRPRYITYNTGII